MISVAQAFELAVEHHQAGNFGPAEELYRQILQVDPNHVNALHLLGVVACQSGRPDVGIPFIQDALRLSPNFADAHKNLATAFSALGSWEESIRSYQRYLAITPDDAEAHFELGFALRLQGKLDEAAASQQQALRLKPGFILAHINQAIIWLLQGKFDLGWPEYEWRWMQAQAAGLAPTFDQPRWDGSALEGKTILVFAEQGLGDTIQFARYLPMVQRCGGKVVLVCQQAVARLLTGMPGIDQIVLEGERLPPFDVQIPLLSLPGIFKTTLDTIPARIPYLAADPGLVEHWRRELEPLPGFRIGIVWQGDPKFTQPACIASDKRRSFPLSLFEPIARLPGVRLFSLQKGHGRDQLAKWPAPCGIIDLGDKLTDFMETAAVMMNLDLIISADTSPAHLAGALGRPVWTVLPFANCWRWLQDSEDSPWYPTMRLFRQKIDRSWEEVFGRMEAELKANIAPDRVLVQ